MQEETLIKIIDWATGDDHGVSSEAIVCFMLGIERSRYGHPSDADDRGRCIRLLNLVPEWWDRLDEMAVLPKSRCHYVEKDGFKIRLEGWEEQIPLIKKEAGK